jgi:hypothetical protein
MASDLQYLYLYLYLMHGPVAAVTEIFIILVEEHRRALRGVFLSEEL